MGLGFSDGFPPSDAKGFWEHWCAAYDGFIATEYGSPCNWCGKTEEAHDKECEGAFG